MNKRSCLMISLFIIVTIGFSFLWVPIFPTQAKPVATTLKLWYFDEGESENYLLSLVAQFETENSGVTINATQIKFEEMFQLYQDNYFKQDYPDLVQLRGDWIPKLVLKDMLQPVGSNLDNSSDIIPSVERGISFFDTKTGVKNVYAFPSAVDTIIGYANAKIFTDASVGTPPTENVWSWTEWLTAATLTNDQRDQNNKTYGFSFTDAPGSFDAFLYGMGGVLFSDHTVDKTHVAITGEPGVAAFQLAGEVVKTRALTPELNEMGTVKTRALFIDQNISMIFDHFSGLQDFLSNDTFGLDNSNLLLYQVPKITTAVSGAPLVIEGFGINSKSTTDATTSSIDLAKLLTSSDSMSDLAIKHLKLPARISPFQNETVKTDRFIQSFMSAIGRSYQIPLSTFWYDSVKTYASRVWTFFGGEPSEAADAAIGVNVFLSTLPPTSTTPVVVPAEIPQILRKFYEPPVIVTTTQINSALEVNMSTSTVKTSPGFSGVFIITIFLFSSIFTIITKKIKKRKNES